MSEMREILFRGKRVDNGEWMEGDLLTYAAYPNRVWITESKTLFSDHLYGITFVEIIPDTLGQYTGLTDKNGVKIFEGDCLKPFNDGFDKMVVEFHRGCFVLGIYADGGRVVEREPLKDYGKDIEVIGNIHDHTELMEGGSEQR